VVLLFFKMINLPKGLIKMTFAVATIPERIRTTRILRGFSQRALARRLNVNQAMVWSWESGAHEPSPASLLKISQALQLSMLWLAFGQGAIEMPKNNEPPVDAEGSSSNSAR
jgi:transcriptional regulator with XRE-family HTH domain